MISSKFLTNVVALAVSSSTFVNAATFDLPIIVGNTYSTIEAEIGTPPETYRFLFDLGSASAWVTKKDCIDNCPNNSGYTRTGYAASASSTSNTTGPYDEITFLGGLTGGVVTTDIFSLASTNGSVSWDQSFLAVNQSSWNFITADGFMGLAFTSIASPNTTTVVEQLMQDGLLDDHRMGIYYGKEFNQTGDNPEGRLTIGASKEDTYVNGSLTYIPLRVETPYEVWRVNLNSMTGIIPGSNSSSVTKITEMPSAFAVFDSGSGAVQVPNESIDDIYASIGMNWTAIINGHYIPKCVDFNSSWSISFDFSDNTRGELIPVVLTGEDLKQPGFANGDLETCYPPFENSPAENPGFTLIGTPFLRKVYSVYDFGAMEVDNYQPRIGLGKLKEEYRP